MATPFLIECVNDADPEAREWRPVDPQIRMLVAHTGPEVEPVVRASMFAAIEDLLPGVYSLDVPVAYARDKALRKVDARSDEIIAQGFLFEGLVFSLTVEAQIRYSTMLMLADSLQYPLGCNSLDDHGILYLQSGDETRGLVFTAMARIKAVVDSGTVQKDFLRSCEDVAVLLAYADPRTLEDLTPGAST